MAALKKPRRPDASAASDNSAEFFAAVQSGNAARVRELLKAAPGLVHERHDHATALHYATWLGHREVVNALLEAGAEVNARDDQHHATPAGWAIEYLREQGGLLGIEIEDLLLAIRNRDVAWARRFVTQHPALRNATDRQGTALRQLAIDTGDPELVRLFQ